MARFLCSRRRFLRTASACGVVGVAGCGGSGGDGGDGGADEAPSGEDYPRIDEWLTETAVGGADDSYDGTVADRRDSGTVTVSVGAQGNGGAFAYAPSALVVSAGTELRWEWTGEGNPHNVEAEPAEQLGESDYEFSSGEPAGGTGVNYARMLQEPGLVLYHCEPHLSLGMKGGIAVE